MIRKKMVSFKKTPKTRQNQEINKQFRLARNDLETHILDGKDIYWLDEAMFTRTTFKKTEWSPKNENFIVSTNQWNPKNAAFLGAICFN